MSVYINKDTKVLVQGITGGTAKFHTKQMLDYGTNIVAGVTPKKGGTEVEGVPVYNTVQDAVDATGANASVLCTCSICSRCDYGSSRCGNGFSHLYY